MCFYGVVYVHFQKIDMTENAGKGTSIGIVHFNLQ